jgi:hypothetical protein
MMLLDLVRQARRRLICNDVLSQGANASSAALFALILLLLLGTQVLEWQWVLVIPIAAVGYGAYRTWSRRPAPYQVAQLLDRKLEFADTLSTALYFDDEARRGSVPGTIRECQFAQAQRLCPEVDVRTAIPFRMPRTAYASVALLMVASSLFALRYGLSHSLDLKPPLAHIIHNSLGGSDPVQRASSPKKDGPRVPDLDQMGMSISDRDSDKLDAAPQNALENSAVPDVDNSNAKQAKAEGKSEEGDQISTGEPGEEGEEGGANGENAGEGQKGTPSSKDGQKNASNQQGSPNEKNNLLDKFKDAMQNLLSKMKIQPPPGGQQQSSQSAQSKQGKAQQGGKQSNGQGQKQRETGREDGAQEGDEADAPGEQSAESKGAGQNGEQQANKQPGSGVGKQDGDKDVKLAEQMAAMGKLSEIIGKRSANVSGEATVEVKNTSQALSTRYESRRSTHGESGAEINRDEVPVALQGYVEKYFERVRQTPKK